MKRRTHLNLDMLEGRALLSGLSYSLTTNQSTYQPGQPVEMTLQETNSSNHEIKVDDGPSIDGFDVTQSGKVIWRSNAGLIPMYIRLVPLEPGQSLTLTATWDGVPTGGTSPVTGTFSIRNQRDPTLTTSIAITTSPTSPSVDPSSPPNGQPIVVTHPDPLPMPPAPGPPSGGTPIGSPVPVGRGGGSTPGSGSSSGTGSTPIIVSVGTNRPTYHHGQHVRMRVTVQNSGSSAVSLSRGSAGGLTLLEGSTPIWHRASIVGKGGSRTIKPGRAVTLTAVWNGRVHYAGMALAGGTYTLTASAGGASGSTTFQVA